MRQARPLACATADLVSPSDAFRRPDAGRSWSGNLMEGPPRSVDRFSMAEHCRRIAVVPSTATRRRWRRLSTDGHPLAGTSRGCASKPSITMPRRRLRNSGRSTPPRQAWRLNRKAIAPARRRAAGARCGTRLPARSDRPDNARTEAILRYFAQLSVAIGGNAPPHDTET